MVNFLVYSSLKRLQQRGKNGFPTKSLCEHPWVLLCLSKASAVVKKTDSCSLSIQCCVMAHIIYLFAAMATAGEAWCMGFLNSLTASFSLMTRTVFHQASALHGIPAVKHTEATMAKQGSAERFEVLFTRRLSTGEGEKRRFPLKLSQCFRHPVQTKKKIGPITQKYEINEQTECYC